LPGIAQLEAVELTPVTLRTTLQERLAKRNAQMILLATDSSNATKLSEQKLITLGERSILYQSLQLIMTLPSKLKLMLKPMLEPQVLAPHHAQARIAT
jgi:hypothetical protein